MDIGIDARFAGQRLSGIGRYTLNLLCGIAAADPPRRIGVLVAGVQRLPSEIRESASFELIEVPQDNPYSLAGQFSLPRIVRRLGLRLLHSPDPFAPLASRCAKVISVHDLIPLTCRHMIWSSVKGRLAPVWRTWLKLQCRFAAAIVTVSRYSASDIVRVLDVPAEKVRVIPPAIRRAAEDDICATADIRKRLPIKGRILLYVGRRDPYKNIVGLIRTFARVRATHAEPATLVIVGSYDARYPEPEEEVRRLGLNDSVVFTDYLPDRELAALYRAASVFVFPSLYEGFGLPPLEAMSRGTPVVASHRTAIPEVLGDAAVLVDATDTTAMAEAIVHVLSDDAFAERLRRKGELRAALFGPKRQGEDTMRVYEDVLIRSRKA